MRTDISHRHAFRLFGVRGTVAYARSRPNSDSGATAHRIPRSDRCPGGILPPKDAAPLHSGGMPLRSVHAAPPQPDRSGRTATVVPPAGRRREAAVYVRGMPEVFVVRPRREAPSVGAGLVPAACESATSAAGPSSARQGGTQVRGRPAATLRSERRPLPDHPAVAPLAPYLGDPEVTDVFINGADGLFVDRGSGAQRVASWRLSEREVRELAVALIGIGGRHIDDLAPVVDVRWEQACPRCSRLSPAAERRSPSGSLRRSSRASTTWVGGACSRPASPTASPASSRSARTCS